MEIIDYKSYGNIDIMLINILSDGTIYYTKRENKSTWAFHNGGISCIFDKTIYNVGYIGGYKYSLNSNCATKWRDMLRRSYDIWT